MASFTERGEPITTTDYPPDTVSFSTDQIKIDIFRKNLFGSKGEEVILQLRQENMNYINVFYTEGGFLKKVPGFITHLGNIYIDYHNEKFIFYFENISNRNINSIITKTNYTYARHVDESYAIWDIQPDSIREVYDITTIYFSYSGVMIYQYDTKRKFQFVGDNYPKTLLIEEKTVNYENMEFTQELDTLSGVKTTRKGPTRVYFKYGDSGLQVERIEDNFVKTRREINKKE